MSAYLDQLMDLCHDAGWEPPKYGRRAGTHTCWVSITIPGLTRPVERYGDTKDEAAMKILLHDLTATEPQQAQTA